ncbi:sensor histidine kinase [Paraburkholderia sp. BR10937]|uniref:sensor histidine kinase n=1 Tax=Paraburkholderia sp. BR10937 TaxID=3236994 RepID=UPI0034D2C5EE
MPVKVHLVDPRRPESYALEDRSSLGVCIAVDQALSESVSRYAFLLARAGDVFVGILAHDLRAPLGAIAMSVQYLLQADELPAQVLRVGACGTRMQRMIADVLDFTRTRLGDLRPVTLASCNVGNFCQQAIADIKTMHPDSAAWWLVDGDLSGSWDRGRLARMVTNLLQNALDHGRPETPVILTIHGSNGVVNLSVFNEGGAHPGLCIAGNLRSVDAHFV